MQISKLFCDVSGDLDTAQKENRELREENRLLKKEKSTLIKYTSDLEELLDANAKTIAMSISELKNMRKDLTTNGKY